MIKDGFQLPNGKDGGNDILKLKPQQIISFSFFERGETDQFTVEIQTVYLFLTEEVINGFCKSPPTTFNLER